MGARENLQRLADQKQQEIRELEAQLERSKIYLQAIQDSIRALPREVPTNGSGADVDLRPGTILAKARDAIRAEGKPLHLNELLARMERPSDKQSRVSLAGSIGWYVRKGQIFTRPAPNTFGLIEMGHANAATTEPDLPETFGA
jgi:hypothetical protein